MPLDPSIILGGRPLQLTSPLELAQQYESIKTSRANARIHDAQLAQIQREGGEREALNAAYGAAYNPTTGLDVAKLQQQLAASGAGSLIPGVQKSQEERRTASLNQQKAEQDLRAGKLQQFRDNLSFVHQPSDYVTLEQSYNNDPLLRPMFEQALRAKGITEEAYYRDLAAKVGTPDGFKTTIANSALGVAKFLETNKPSVIQQNLGNEARVLSVEPLTGKTTTLKSDKLGTSPDASARLTFDQRVQKFKEDQAAKEQNPEFVAQLAGAKKAGELAATNKDEAQKTLPAQVQTATNILDLTNRMIGKSDKPLTSSDDAREGVHPGLKKSLGYLAGRATRFSGLNENVNNFVALYEQLKGDTFRRGVEYLKGTGSVSNIEGETITKALSSLDISRQTPKEFINEVIRIRKSLRVMLNQARAKSKEYGVDTYGLAPFLKSEGTNVTTQ